ncbi:MAG TPA: hypothetical protein PLZ21_00005 [Armatimonadota bacterium]|nr:hypothetical protein [Armatimonadota bacterium]
MQRDLRSELANDEPQWGKAWNPQHGEILVGILRSYTRASNNFGTCHVANVEDEQTGQIVSVWLSSTVLLDLFRQHHPKRGERLGIKYLGKHPEKGYRLYRLLLDRGEEPISFEPLGGETESPADDSGDPNDLFGWPSKTDSIQPSERFREKLKERAGIS